MSQNEHNHKPFKLFIIFIKQSSSKIRNTYYLYFAAEVVVMKITLLDVISEEVIRLFSDQDDYMMEFFGADSVYYTRYSKIKK